MTQFERERRAVLHLAKRLIIEDDDSDFLKSYPYNPKDLLAYGIAVVGGGDGLIGCNLSLEERNILLEEFGITDAVKNTFHRSWEKVADADYYTLVVEQMVHYLSTYGMESIGFAACPVVPIEEVLGKNSKVPIRALTIVPVVGMSDVESLVGKIFTTVAAPHKNDIEYYEDIVGLTKGVCKPEEIKSYELRCLYYDYFELVPSDPDEFVRFIVYKLTGSTLVVKNKKTINALRSATPEHTEDLKKWFAKIPLTRLAKVFYRYKPLFLALRATPSMRPIINTLRRMAKTCHAPMSEKRVQNLSNLFAQGKFDEGYEVIHRMTMRELIKVMNFASGADAAKRMNISTEFYNIRTGSIHVDEQHSHKNVETLRDAILREIAERVSDTMSGKIFYIPSYIDYAAPVSEKQFLGNIPYGTTITLPKEVSAGVYWENYKGMRTDIDLHLTGPTMNYGWNTWYRNDNDKNILYSGDMTDATNGAAEAYYLNTLAQSEPLVMNANNFTGMEGVPFKLVFTESKFDVDKHDAKTPPIDISKTMFPPIDMMFKDSNEQTIGVFNKNKFYIYGGTLNDSIVPNRDEYRKFLDAALCKMGVVASLDALLRAAGAEVIDETDYAELDSSEAENVINLSPNALTRTTLIDLIDSFDKVN